MVDASWQMISVVGHLDLPKLYAPLPACLADLDGADNETSRRLSTLLEMIAERNLALDVNLSGLRKGVGIYPHPEILRRARGAGNPGSHRHGHARAGGPGQRLRGGAGGGAGARATATTSRSPGASRRSGRSATGRGVVPGPQPRHGDPQPPVCQRAAAGDPAPLVRRRASRRCMKDFPESSSLGSFHALRVRKEERSITISDRMPAYEGGEIVCLFSHHRDTPGHARRAAEHAGLGGDQRGDRVAELPAGRDGHRLPHAGRAAGAHPGGGGVRAGDRRRTASCASTPRCACGCRR